MQWPSIDSTAFWGLVMRSVVFTFAVFLALAASLPAFAAKRVALVIGNSNYRFLTPLQKSADDARAIADMLLKLGFEVTVATDVSYHTFQQNLQDFASSLEDAELSLFFYSGHAVQFNGRNHLLPVDARVRSELDLDFEAVPLNFILSVVESRPRTALYFFDASRNNPFAEWAGSRRAISGGLAPVQPGIGSMVSFATQPGNVAVEGDGPHSLYVQSLLKHLPIIGQEIERSMSRARSDVIQWSDGAQLPWEFSSLSGTVYLAGKLALKAPETAVESNALPPPTDPIVLEKKVPTPEQIETRDRVESAKRDFDLVREMDECHAYRAFTERYADTFYADISHAYLTENCAIEDAAEVANNETRSGAPGSPDKNRLALLIGNQSYVDAVGPLRNPHNDIALLGAALGTARFDVMNPVRDATRKQIRRSVRAYARQLAALGDNAVGFFYYSGHGAAETETGPNYLIPVDATSMEGEDVWDDSVSLSWVVKTIQDTAPKAAHFIVFDACRNELRRTDYRNSHKGFVPLIQKNGLFIAFSTAPGTRALDGDGASGPYAAALAKQLVTPDQHHLDVFQSAKEDVFETTGQRQTPWERNGLLKRVYFLKQ